MEFEFLSPLEPHIIKFANGLSQKQLGFTLIKNQVNNFPVLNGIKLAIIAVLENRNDNSATAEVNISHIRKQIYQLYPGNWRNEIADLGDINQGETTEDTFFALKLIVERLVKSDIIPIIIGGTQDLTYPIYRAFDNLDQMVNLVSMDSKFDFGKEDQPVKLDSYLSRIIADEPNNLFNYSNLGFQTYFNAQEEIDLIEKLYFEAYRLGDISNNITIAEPVLRDADIVIIDLTSIKSADSGNLISFAPNGFDGKEICSLARYSGISSKVKVYGIFNHNNSKNESFLISQIIWYFIEGYYFRNSENPTRDETHFIKYNVPVEEQQLVFYKSNKTQRWWMETPHYGNVNNKAHRNTLLPCTYEEYLNCCKLDIPERWWKAQRKNIL